MDVQNERSHMLGLVPRYPLQKPPSRGEGRRSEGRRGLHLRKASRGLQGGFKGFKPSALKGALRGLEGGLKGASSSRGLEAFSLKPSSLEGSFKDASRRLQVLLVVVGLDMCKVCTTVYIP